MCNVLGGAVFREEVARSHVAVQRVGQLGFHVLEVLELVGEQVGDRTILVEG